MDTNSFVELEPQVFSAEGNHPEQLLCIYLHAVCLGKEVAAHGDMSELLSLGWLSRGTAWPG